MEIVLLIVLIALLVYYNSSQKSKLHNLEDRLRHLTQLFEASQKERQEKEKPIPEKPLHTSEPAVVPIAVAIPEPVVEAVPEPEPQPIEPIETPASPEPEIIPRAPYVPEPSWWEKFKEKNPDLEKFIGENLINKIGVLILVLGISYFVKFAIDKEWINEPARVGIGILCGALVMGFAHKLRKNYAAFSSVLVAGAVAIFYFTIGIAFHDYHLLNQTMAFVIMVIITGFSCLVSLSYNRKELAVLSLIGGFAVPFMVSTGQGNYIVLFTYILILDIGILALAYHRRWPIINILSYIFTVLLYGGWLFQTISNEEHPPYLGALCFGFGFYFLFILINIINNLRTKGIFTITELSILASNTFLFYAAGMFILGNSHPELRGLFTVGLALLNMAYSWFLYKKFGLDKTAVYLLIGLTLTFITMAVPVQFEGNYITLFWAAEAVILLWLAQKSAIIGYRFVSVAVQFLMVISLVMDWCNGYFGIAPLNIIGNPVFLTAAFVCISVFVAAWLLRDEKTVLRQFGINFNPEVYRQFLTVAGIVLVYCTGLFETIYQSGDYIGNNASATALPVTYHLAASVLLFHYLRRGKNDSALRLANLLGMVNILLAVFWFSNLAFWEHTDYMAYGKYCRIAFFAHYFLLFAIFYFGYGLYQMNREKAVFRIFHHKIIFWAAAFFLIYIASNELLLHLQVASNTPVTVAELTANEQFQYYKTNPEWLRMLLANERIETVNRQVIKTGLPILWGILAFLFLITGIKRRNKSIRIIALSLLGLTILKLFLFDIRNASETGKIVAFILLGVLILIISFVYQKIKTLVLDDDKKPADETK